MADRPLPSGTVAFLFTDIEGSTARWEQRGPTMRDALARHDAVVRAAIEGHGGAVFKTVGDAFCAAFGTAPDALAAALAAQRGLGREDWGALGSLRVRVAVHVGAAEERDRDYFGPAVNRVARLLSAGHGGQVLLSQAAEQLVRDTLPADVDLRDLGEHRLKDLERPERIFQAVADDLPSDFPDLRTLDRRRHNLPIQLTPFVGRAREVAQIRDVVRANGTRLVTLTGPGGTGKTRLALQVAADLVDDYADGTWFVELAPITEPELVPTAIAQALGVREVPGRSLVEAVTDELGTKQALLVLDNMEQVLPAATLVGNLLRACAALMVLTTSRAPLRISGEREVPIPPLAVLDPAEDASVGRVLESDAVRLFAERALAVNPAFALSAENAATVAQICQRLDGLPLAIELAAARTRLLPPLALLARLDTRLHLLAGGSRDLPARQQTMRAAIAWSHDLLAPDEQALFRSLAPFAGGFTLEAAEAVAGHGAGGGMSVPAIDVFDGLAALTEHSLVRQEEQAGEPRFAMLETIREFATEQAERSGEAAAIFDAHRVFFLDLAEQLATKHGDPSETAWLDRIEQEHDNVRAALRWSIDRRDAESALRFCNALWWVFWIARGHYTEGRRWVEAALAMPGAADQPARAMALVGAGTFDHYLGEGARAQRRLDEGIKLSRERKDSQVLVQALIMAGVVHRDRGDAARAEELLEEGLSLARATDNRWGTVMALQWLGMLAQAAGDLDAAAARFEEGLAIGRSHGSPRGTAWPLLTLAQVERGRGNSDRAREFCEESLALFEELGDQSGIALARQLLGVIGYQHGDWSAAAGHFGVSVRAIQAMVLPWPLAESEEGLAEIAAHVGDLESAARLLGSAAAFREMLGIPTPAYARDLVERRIADLRAHLGESAFVAAWEAGRSLDFHQAAAAALAVAERVASPPSGVGG